MSLTLVLPGARLAAGAGFSPTDGLHLPALQALLGKSQRYTLPGASPDTCLQTAFGAQACAPVALTRPLDLPDQPEGHWLRADPVHLRLGRDRAMLLDASACPLRQDEADALVNTLNRQFAPDGLHFFAPHPARWYVRSDQPLAVSTTPLDQVAGRDMQAHLPQGPDGLRWHGWLNEIQMLLYTHPVNDAREAEGQLPVTALWLWGEGAPLVPLEKPASPVLVGKGRVNKVGANKVLVKVLANEVLAHGLAQAAGLAFAPLPARCPETLADDTLVWLDALLPAARRGDFGVWRETLQALEQDWFAPVHDLWRRGKIRHLRLLLPDAGGTLAAELPMTNRWKFWRRDGSLTTLTLL